MFVVWMKYVYLTEWGKIEQIPDEMVVESN